MLRNLLLVTGLLLLLTSCAFTEEIHIKNDGSGTYNFKMDMSEMLTAMNDLGTKDSLKESKSIDTVYFFNDILEEKRDSISRLSAEDQASLQELADMSLHMQVDEEKNKMLMNFGLGFKDISKLKNIEEKISKAMTINKNQDNSSEMINKSNVVFSFDGNNFVRKTKLKNLSKEEEEKVAADMEQSSSFLEGSTYKLIYHFDKKIKNVSIKDAEISGDGKTLTIEVPMDSLIKNPQLLDFKLKLK